MAGWSMIADGSNLDSGRTPKKFESTTRLVVDLQSVLEFKPDELLNPSSEGLIGKLRCWFEECLGLFLKEICAKDAFRPLPPLLGDGQCVDLFKLFLVVREKGGCNAVSENRLWDSVTKESGLGLSFTAAVKLVYIKYLDTLERWLGRVAVKDPKTCLSSSGSDLDEYLMELQAGFKGFLSEISDAKLANDGGLYTHLGLPCDLNLAKSNGEWKSDDGGGENLNSDFGKKIGDDGKLCADDVKLLEGETDMSKKCADGSGGFLCSDIKQMHGAHEIKNVVDLVEEKSCDDDNNDNDDDEDLMILDPEAVDKENFKSKRKRESLWGMLNWVIKVAKDPCDPTIGIVPDKSKWKSYSDSELWKQVLMAREAIFSKRNIEPGSEQYYLQKIQRMHPSMYDDQPGSGYNLRGRLRCGNNLLYGKMAFQANSDSSDLDRSPTPGSAGLEDHIDKQLGVLDSMPLKPIPLGSNFQAEVPEWTGETSESESKWLGSRFWPLEKTENRFLIERDPIGKGRQDSCGCQVTGSAECVRFHVAEKRLRLKRELGLAFYQWRFDQMGEDVALSWTKEDQKKFKDIVSSNPPSIETSFWNKIFKSFPTKNREDLMRYYFNVFVLFRRGYQNRFTPTYYDSDNDEFESTLVVANSYGREMHGLLSDNFLHENKQHENNR